jgi:hypothetical protein
MLLAFVDCPVYPRWQQICLPHGSTANSFVGRAVVVRNTVDRLDV